MKTSILTLILTMASLTTAMAQDDPEYRREIGVGVGMSNYLGDFNGSLTKGMQPSVSIVYRRLFSPYCGLRFDLGHTQLKGSSADVTTYYPDYAEEPYTFKRNVTDFNVVFEYNFWYLWNGKRLSGSTTADTLYLPGTRNDIRLRQRSQQQCGGKRPYRT